MPSIRWEDNNGAYPEPDDDLGHPDIVRNLTELINHAIPDAAQQVDRAYNKWNQKIRDRLRDETGFKLTRGEQKVAIKVEVAYSMPLALQQVLKSYDPQWAELLIHRGQFNDAASGMEIANRKLARITQVLRNSAPTPGEIDSFRTVLALLTKLNAELAAKELTKTILTIDQDALGAYYYRAGKVRLFWLPIALVSMSGGHSIEALTFVTLAHELAHAYTHLGMDIDGYDWNTADFADADLELIEGLAQYYTEVTCDHVLEQFPEARACFEHMLTMMRPHYNAYRKWDACDSGESMRAFLISASMRDQHPIQARYIQTPHESHE